jgi:hypothetical protein
MSWATRHCEEGRVLVVARVAAEGNRYTVSLVEPRRTASHVLHYSTRALAFAAAEALLGHRVRGHACSGSCSRWTQDADVR